MIARFPGKVAQDNKNISDRHGYDLEMQLTHTVKRRVRLCCRFTNNVIEVPESGTLNDIVIIRVLCR